jgi:hypothetical protein
MRHPVIEISWIEYLREQLNILNPPQAHILHLIQILWWYHSSHCLDAHTALRREKKIDVPNEKTFVRIVQCSDYASWHSKSIGSEYLLVTFEDRYVWVLSNTPEGYVIRSLPTSDIFTIPNFDR